MAQVATFYAVATMLLFAEIVVVVNNNFMIVAAALIIKLYKRLVLILFLTKFAAFLFSGSSCPTFNLLK